MTIKRLDLLTLLQLLCLFTRSGRSHDHGQNTSFGEHSVEAPQHIRGVDARVVPGRK